MKARKPERGVSDMDVLKDIRSLLSVTQEREGSAKARSKEERNVEAEAIRLREQVRYYAELVKKQQEELEKLTSEREKLAAELNLLHSGTDKTLSLVTGVEELRQEIDQLEARKNGLSLILSQIDDLLQLKVKELSRRIVRFYQEAGQEGVALEFRKAASELEVTETFAYFLRALMKE
ncbi:MAG: hypothetical protein FJ045_04845 [Crenarchaeota archaeon]|nr:hypothetical protein [Thermoproteota archaeon]